jgi:phosphoribosylanthranilate isomerase
MKVKICGLTRREDLAACQGADLVGVVTGYPRSPRNLSLSEAKGILEAARGRFLRVVVLTAPSASDIAAAFKAGADRVQVHGPLPTGGAAAPAATLIPSLALTKDPARGLPPTWDRLWRGPFPLVHLDTAGEDRAGGTGRAWDWARWAGPLTREPRDFLLAGGLTSENVVRAMDALHPWGVDVSSGVESRPGEKDPARIQAFIRTVRAWEGAHA